MIRARKVPGRDELRRLLIAGNTRADIARQYNVTHQAIQMAVKRYGLAQHVTQPPKPDYSAYLPWGKLGDWGDHYLVLMLREDAYAEIHGDSRPRMATRLPKFREYMWRENLVAVWHGPDVGFTLDPRRDGDWELIRPTDAYGEVLCGPDGHALSEPWRSVTRVRA